jgi:hypothetical protein
VIVWLRVNMHLGWSATIHAPWPSAAAPEMYRAVAITRPPNSAVMKSSSIRAAMRNLTFGSEVRKVSDKPRRSATLPGGTSVRGKEKVYGSIP